MEWFYFILQQNFKISTKKYVILYWIPSWGVTQDQLINLTLNNFQ